MNHIEKNKDRFANYAERLPRETMEEYIQRGRRDKEWGSSAELLAFSEISHRPVLKWERDQFTGEVFIDPNTGNINMDKYDTNPVNVFYNGIHYDPLRPSFGYGKYIKKRRSHKRKLKRKKGRRSRKRLKYILIKF